MTRLSLLSILLALPAPAFSEAFSRPVPQAQTAAAEFWFAAASISLLLALLLVNWMVHRK